MAVQRNFVAQHTFEVVFTIIELVIIFLYGFCFQYPGNIGVITVAGSATSAVQITPNFAYIYPYYIDIHVMVFIGFGLLVAYLKNHGWTAIGINFVVAALTLQVYILFRQFWLASFNANWATVNLSFDMLLTAEYCIASVLITWTAVVGRLGAFQLVTISVGQAFLYSLNEIICLTRIKGFDLGGSMTVFAFGGIFALASGLLNRAPPNKEYPANDVTNHHATLFAFIGTLFLWVFFPSFNAARVNLDINYGFPYGDQSVRAVLTTLLALTGSVVSTYVFSSLTSGAKLNIEHILRATLAGGVISASNGDLCQEPYAALIIGLFAGATTTLLYRILHSRLKTYDTLGASYLFLWNGILGGLISAMYAGSFTTNKLGFEPQPFARTVNAQGGSQLAILGVSLFIGFFGGLLHGLIVKLCPCYKPEDEALYEDRDLWAPKKESSNPYN